MKEMVLSHSNTTRFILPLLGIDKGVVLTENFVGSYLRIDHLLELDNTLILVYLGENRDIKTLAKQSQIIDEYYVYIIEKDNILHDTIKKFINGKYSMFYQVSKSKILKFWGLNKYSRLAYILYPNDYLFEQNGRMLKSNKSFEIWQKPDMDKETFKFQL